MKTFNSSRVHSYLLTLVTAGLSIAFITTTFGKKDDAVSPVLPKVTLCHKNSTISVAEAAVQSHLAHGDTLGACPSSLGADATPSKPDAPPPSGSVSSPSVASAAVRTVPAAPKAPSAPVAPALGAAAAIPPPSTLPSVTPPLAAPVRPAIAAPLPVLTAPVLSGDEVAVCYKENTLMISRSSIQEYLDLGATLGRCPETQ